MHRSPSPEPPPVAAVYATNPDGTLVVSPDNQSRGQLNTRIRAALQETGHVGREDRPITVLVPGRI